MIPLETAITLSRSLHSFIEKNIEPKRFSRTATILIKSGESSNNRVFKKIAECICDHQQTDGGWADVLETCWSTAFLKCIRCKEQTIIENSVKWLRQEQHKDGSWGNIKRDYGRIPVTAQAIFLLPELADKESLEWLENNWSKDLSSDPKLTYKGAFSLMAFRETKYHPNDTDLIHKTIDYLQNEQNDDGGFAPWKNHPIGSEPYSTGIALLGLLAYPEFIEKKTIKKSICWLENNQMENGLWPCHYIEEGSAWAFWGLVEALKLIQEQK